MSAADQSPNEFAQLRHRRDELERRYEKILERVALFPNPVSERELERLSDDLARTDRRLALLRPVAT